MSAFNSTSNTTKYTDFDVSRFDVTELTENKQSKSQMLAFPRYTNPNSDDTNLYIQMPRINLKQGGIPQIGEFYPDDSKRSFLRVALDESIPEIKEFVDSVLKPIDKKLSSDGFKQKLFGKKAEKYNYVSTYRLPQEDDNEEKEKKYGPKLPYCKLKLDTTYPDNKVKTIVYNVSTDANGKKTRTKIDDIETIDDLTKYINFNCHYRAIIKPVKLWAQLAKIKDPEYGLTFKLVKIEVEPSSNLSQNTKEYLGKDTFIDSDDESVKEPVKKSQNKKQESESDESDDEPVKKPQNNKKQAEESDDSDEEPVVKKPQPKGKKQPIEVASDDSDEEPVKKPQAVQKPVESDDSDEEPVKPPVKGKKPPVEVASDDSDEEQPKLGKKKAVKKIDSDSDGESDKEKPVKGKGKKTGKK